MFLLTLASGDGTEFALLTISELTNSLTRIIFSSEKFLIYLCVSCMLLKKVIFIHWYPSLTQFTFLFKMEKKVDRSVLLASLFSLLKEKPCCAEFQACLERSSGSTEISRNEGS